MTASHKIMIGSVMRVKRISAIKDYMIKNRSASLKELCNHFGVSLNTIRRDVEVLENEGFITKVYGGIVLADENNVVPLSTRSVLNREAKEAICERAASLLLGCRTIYIDSGTTTVSLLKHIHPDMNLTIISNSLDLFNEAAKHPGCKVISLGGLLSFSTNSFVGIPAIKSLQGQRIDKAFMGATAVSIEEGATNNSYHESEIKRAVIENSGQVIVLADSTKIEHSASLSFCRFEDIDVLVTEKAPSDDWLQAASEMGVECLY